MRRVLVLCLLLPSVAVSQPPPMPPPNSAPLNNPWPPVAPGLQPLAPGAAPVDPGPEILPLALPEAGWYFDFQNQLLFAKIDGQIGGYVPIGRSFVTPVILPNAELDTGASNQFALGYRFGPDLGALQMSYRSQAARGRELYAPYGGFDGEVTSRLDSNVVNVSYLAPAWQLGDGWSANWSVGGRLGTVFFDARALSPYMDQSSNNFFIGAGPTGSAGIAKQLNPNWSLFANADYGVLFGRVTQEHRYALTVANPLFGYNEQRSTRATHQLSVQAGVGYEGPNVRLGGLRVGYQFEEWFNIGNLGPARADLITHGIFVQWQVRF
jgi:hypothetical protein